MWSWAMHRCWHSLINPLITAAGRQAGIAEWPASLTEGIRSRISACYLVKQRWQLIRGLRYRYCTCPTIRAHHRQRAGGTPMPRPNPRDPETDLGAALGETLRDLRIDAGFRTQEDFARASGYAREGISRVETGDTLPGTTMFTDSLDACQATPRERKLLARQLTIARKARGPIPQFIQKWFANEAQASFL